MGRPKKKDGTKLPKHRMLIYIDGRTYGQLHIAAYQREGGMSAFCDAAIREKLSRFDSDNIIKYLSYHHADLIQRAKTSIGNYNTAIRKKQGPVGLVYNDLLAGEPAPELPEVDVMAFVPCLHCGAIGEHECVPTNE